jgi:hypothetical protein
LCLEKAVFDENGPDLKECWIHELLNKNISELNEVFESLQKVVKYTQYNNSLNSIEQIKKTINILTKLRSFVASNITELDFENAFNITNDLLNAFNYLIPQNAWISDNSSEKKVIASQVLLQIQYTSFYLCKFEKFLKFEKEFLISSVYFTDYSEDILFEAKNSSILIPKHINTDESNSNSGIGSLISHLDNYLINGLNASQSINTDIIAFSATNSNKTMQLTDGKKVIVRYKNSELNELTINNYFNHN